MNKKIYILFIVSILTISSAVGQFIGKDNLSISLFYLQKTELDSAKKYIDLSILDEDLKSTPKVWYWRGYIYKELYKRTEKNNKTSPLRLESIESFKNLKKIDNSEEFKTDKMLLYLATTLYNDVVKLLTPQNYKTAASNYDLFRSTMLLIDPNTDLKSRDVKFKLALASMLNRPQKNARGLDSLQTYQVKKVYSEILALDPNNPSANYNLATIYYNEGADIINKMDYDMDLEHLNKEQDRFIGIFLEGLPYMKKAYALNYKRKETLMGLSNIYYGLNDLEKSDYYRHELEVLEKKMEDLEKE